MRVLKTLQPGALGTRRFTARFGKSLVCVRYRHDPATGARVTTVELIDENTRIYLPRPKHEDGSRPSSLEPLCVRLERGEALLRQQIKAARGIWRYPEMVWEVTPEIVKRLRLRDRLVRAGEGRRRAPGAASPDAYSCCLLIPINSYPWQSLDIRANLC